MTLEPYVEVPYKEKIDKLLKIIHDLRNEVDKYKHLVRKSGEIFEKILYKERTIPTDDKSTFIMAYIVEVMKSGKV